MKAAPKSCARRVRVNGEDALITGMDLVRPLFALIPEGYSLIETQTEYVGVLNEQTGDSCDLEWCEIPEHARLTLYPEYYDPQDRR